MTVITTINKTEYTLLSCLNQSLHPSGGGNAVSSLKVAQEELQPLLSLADRHEVLTLLGDVLNLEQLSDEENMYIQSKIARTVHKSIRLQVLNAKLTAALEKEGIIGVTLKGCVVARYYPVPEFRKSSDVDLFVNGEAAAGRAVEILKNHGFQLSEEWHANHHAVLRSAKGDVVEVHTAWADEFRDKHLNQVLEKLQKESRYHEKKTEVQGMQVYALDTAWQAFYLMIHMLQHFVGSGFGVRNLCDWVVLWEHCEDEKAREDFRQMVHESGTEEFAKAMTGICICYLGLPRQKSPFPENDMADPETVNELLRDILDAGEFGYSETERMVGMDGDSWTSYVKEFHHQMHINFPKCGKVFIFWPVLWISTLVRFLRNNRKLHRAPISAIMKKAGERGKLVRRLTEGKKNV